MFESFNPHNRKEKNGIEQWDQSLKMHEVKSGIEALWSIMVSSEVVVGCLIAIIID